MLERLDAHEGDLILLVAEMAPVPSVALGAIRVEVAKRENLADSNELAFARVTEFPLFDWDEANQRWDAVHHPFTSPMDEDLPILEEQTGEVRAKAYDLVCNGWELGGGSIRIHRRDIQERAFKLLGYGKEEAEERFGHLLRAFQYGAPPHGGFAVGLDRTVAIFGDESNIREVMAFPKNQSAQDLLMGAPSPVAEAQLKDLYIALVPPPEPR